MKKKILSICFTALLGISLISCGTSNTTKDKNTDNGKINVMVSFYPLKDFTEQIGGDKVEVKTLMPNNMEPHDYEPKTKDFETLINSDLFIYNGAGLETWVDKVNESIKDEKVTLVDSSTGIDTLKLVEEEHDEDSESEEEHEHNGVDPHIWLSLKNAQIQCENIKNALVKADPDNKDFYEQNLKTYDEKLQTLYDQYAEKFKEVSNKDFITGHAAFGYLCKDFGLEQQSVENVFGEGEPTPKQLQSLVDFCKENNIKTIFSESLASPKVSETLASEVGAEVVPIYTLESQEDDKDYIQSMEYNLQHIYDSLSKK